MHLNGICNVREAHDVAEDVSQNRREYASRADIEECCIEAKQRCIRELEGWVIPCQSDVQLESCLYIPADIKPLFRACRVLPYLTYTSYAWWACAEEGRGRQRAVLATTCRRTYTEIQRRNEDEMLPTTTVKPRRANQRTSKDKFFREGSLCIFNGDQRHSNTHRLHRRFTHNDKVPQALQAREPLYDI